MLQHPLYDSAAILMDTHLIDSVLERIYYELNLWTLYLLYYLLNDMVAILILHTIVDLASYL
jgi:hypothetical protein